MSTSGNYSTESGSVVVWERHDVSAHRYGHGMKVPTRLNDFRLSVSPF